MSQCNPLALFSSINNSVATNIEQQNINHGQSKIVRDYSSNSKGHFVASETTYKNGSVESHTDLATNNMYNTNKNTNIKGDSINDTKGSLSNIIGGLTEMVTGSNYHITGTAESFRMQYQKQADDAQQKLVAARSQPETVPDYSSASIANNLFDLGANLLKNVFCPPAKDVKKNMTDAKGPVTGASVGGIMYDIATELKKVLSFSTLLGSGTASQMAKVQANSKQEKAEGNFDAKKKAYDKLTEAQKKIHDEGIGKKLFPSSDGKMPEKFSVANLMQMFIPPSTKNLKPTKHFDIEKYKEIASEVATKHGGTIDCERKV